MRKNLLFLTAGIIFLIQPVLAESAELTASQIMKKAFWANKLDGSEVLSTLFIYNSRGNVRERKIAAISKLYDNGHTEKGLLRFIAPADVKGTGLLTFDYEKKKDDIWFFLPALRKTRRIVSAEKAKRFMGSEFSYADMTPPPIEDFHYRLLKIEVVRKTKCWVIESVPASPKIAEENGFSKRISYIGKKDFTTRKAYYYDLHKALQKELEVYEVKEIDTEKHRYRAMHLEMVNKQNKRRSVIKVHKIKLRRKVPDKYFTIRYLERQ